MPPRQQRPEVPLDHILPNKVVFESFPPRQPHPPPQRRIIEQPRDLPGQVGRVAGSNSKPVTPSVTVYGNPPMRLAMTGIPDAIASTDVRLSESWAIVGTRQISASR